MTIVPIEAVYVDANFKEAQLRKVRLGQPAVLTTDLYGGAVKYHGKVVGLAGGTGAAFALIPAQNATGNWIKVVQRLPVRIALDPEELRAHPLRVGPVDERRHRRVAALGERIRHGRSGTNGRRAIGDFSPMSGAPLWLAGVLLALGNFMVVLDMTIANVSVPNIAGGLAVSPSQGTWVITSYAVAEAIMVPLTGWLAQRFGAVRVFVVGDARLRHLLGAVRACALAGLPGAVPRDAGPLRRPDHADVADPAAAHLPAARSRARPWACGR